MAANANITQSAQLDNKIYGPSASVRKTYFDRKLSSSITISYNNAYTNGTRASEVMNVRAGANYTWKEKHQFSLNLTRSGRSSAQGETELHFNELTVQFGYNYNFSIGQ